MLLINKLLKTKSRDLKVVDTLNGVIYETTNFDKADAYTHSMSERRITRILCETESLLYVEVF